MKNHKLWKLIAVLLCLATLTGLLGMASPAASIQPEAEEADKNSAETAEQAEAMEEGDIAPSETPEPTDTAEQTGATGVASTTEPTAEPTTEPADPTASPDTTTPAGPKESVEPENTENSTPETVDPAVTDGEAAEHTAAGVDATPAATSSAAPSEEILQVENTPKPVAVEEISLSDLKFRYRDPLINAAKEKTNVLWVTVSSALTNDELAQYTFELTGPDPGSASVKLEKATLTPNGRQIWWENVSFTGGGQYTLKATKDSAVASTTIDIYQVTFDPSPGKFTSQEGTYTNYGMKDSRWEVYGVPSEVTYEEGSSFIGWSTESNITSYDKVISSLTNTSVTGYTITLHAAFGTPKTYRLALKDSSSSELTEKPLENSFSYGDSKTISLTLENTGTEKLTSIRMLRRPDNYDVKVGDLSSMESGASCAVTLTPKEGLGIGEYTDTIAFSSGAGSSEAYVEATIKTTVTGRQVTVTPEQTEKEYGATLSGKDISVTFDPPETTWETLKAELHSEGFAADAEIGSYGYTVSGGEGYAITIAEGSQLTVKQATLSGSVTASPVHVNGKLSDSELTGSFTSHGKSVKGSLTWDAPETTVNAKGPYPWTFTPEDSTHYTKATGTAEVDVTDATLTTLSLAEGSETDVIYNGNPQALSFTSNRPDGEKGEIKVQYSSVEEPDTWSETAPTDAGTYTVLATVEKSKTYAAGTMEVTLTIQPKTIKATANVEPKVYDGTTTATVTPYLPGVLTGDKAAVKATAEAEFTTPNAGSRSVTVTFTLSGEKAKNYQLEKNPVTTSASIIPAKITGISLTREIKKEYGDTLFFTSDMFTVEGLVNGETLEQAEIDFTSEGALSATKVGDYPIQAVIHGNYTNKDGNNNPIDVGTVTVVRAEPKVSLSGIHAGLGTAESKLGDVELDGLFVNPHDESMIVEGTLEWVDPDTMLPTGSDSYEAKWKFTASDSTNYITPTEGVVTVTLTPKAVIHVNAESKVTEYNGDKQGIEATFKNPEEADKADIEVEYRLHQDIKDIQVVSAAETALSADFTTEQPKDVGVYDVHIHIYVKEEYQETYADNLVQTTLEITQASPNVMVTVDPVEEGTILGNVEESHTVQGVKEEQPDGTLLWDHPNEVLTETGEHAWTFKPEDPNYREVKGSCEIQVIADTEPTPTETTEPTFSPTPSPTATPEPPDTPVPTKKPEQDVVVQVQPGAPSVSIPESEQKKLADAVLKDDDKEQAKNGVPVEIKLNVKDISDSVTSDEKAAVVNAMESLTGSGWQVGEYLDMTLEKIIGGKSTKIEPTIDEIEVVITVPQKLSAAGRTFKVVRLHEGTSTVLGDQDNNPNTITIRTNQFSTYAIIYSDVPSTVTPGKTQIPENTVRPMPTQNSASPNTGDNQAPGIYALLLTGCLVGLGAVLMYWKIKKRGKDVK